MVEATFRFPDQLDKLKSVNPEYVPLFVKFPFKNNVAPAAILRNSEFALIVRFPPINVPFAELDDEDAHLLAILPPFTTTSPNNSLPLLA